jgi:hypothetical protein
MIPIPPAVSVAVAVAVADQLPFACNVKALSRAERMRHTDNTKRLKAAVAETQEGERSLRFRVSDERMDLTALAEWVRLERRCCPFFTFQIELQDGGGPTWLTLSGRSGVKEFIRLEIGLE